MGFSLIAAAAILGVTLFIAVELITRDLLPTIEEINDSYSEMKERLSNHLQTDINISSVTRTANGSNYDYNISVQNTGSITLPTEDFLVLINGTEYGFTVPQTYLYPEKNGYFNVYNVAGGGIKRIKVISNNGIADYYNIT